MKPEFDKYQQLLNNERDLLLSELAQVGVKNPNIQNDWEPKESNLNTETADWNERADAMENYSENAAMNNELELQLARVELALQKISKGTFGTCDSCGKPISGERLTAMPTAVTCQDCM